MTEMRTPSPADLCWNVKFPPEQDWIEESIYAALHRICGRARGAAQPVAGDESLAAELMEVAIEKAVSKLKEGPPAEAPEVALMLCRLYAQEVRRWRRANSKMALFGSIEDLPCDSIQNPLAPVDSAIDLEVILHDEPPSVRLALLLRYSQTQWAEVADILECTEASIRVRCRRAIERVRKRLRIKDNGT
jgi:DNA-directed RNA polymerase specialized sigma24 family protein